MSHHGGFDGSLLDSRRFLETIRVNTTEKLFGQIHSIKSFNCFVPVGIEVGIGQASISRCFSFRGGGSNAMPFKKRQKRKRIMVREEERNYACYLFVQGKQLVDGDVKVARLIE